MTIEDEIKTRRSWNEVKGIAGDRNAWKIFMEALCSTRSKRTWRWWWWWWWFIAVVDPMKCSVCVVDWIWEKEIWICCKWETTSIRNWNCVWRMSTSFSVKKKKKSVWCVAYAAFDLRSVDNERCVVSNKVRHCTHSENFRRPSMAKFLWGIAWTALRTLEFQHFHRVYVKLVSFSECSHRRRLVCLGYYLPLLGSLKSCRFSKLPKECTFPMYSVWS